MHCYLLIRKSYIGDFKRYKGVNMAKTKKTNNKARKPDNTEKIPYPYDADKIGKDVSKDRV